MLGSSSSTPGSLKPWYYVVHALQRLPTRQITIADASRFCYGTATVECAGVGEAREDADEIVEVPPNTGMVQSHVVALVPGAPICEHGACQSCIDNEFRDAVLCQPRPDPHLSCGFMPGTEHPVTRCLSISSPANGPKIS